MIRFGISTYSYSRLLNNKTFTLSDAVRHAKQIGFDVLEVQDATLQKGASKQEAAACLRDICREAGMTIGNYTVEADFLNAFNGDADREIDRMKQEIDIARILGATSVRHDATRGFGSSAPGARSFEDALPVLARACKEITHYAARFGIVTMVENHGLFCQDSCRMERLACGVDESNFGLLVDMGNFLCVDEDPAVATGRLAKYAKWVHCKDFHIKKGTDPDPGKAWLYTRAGNRLLGTVVGYGEVPIVSCLSILKRNGYSGIVSLEFEGTEDTLTAIETGFENLSRYLMLV